MNPEQWWYWNDLFNKKQIKNLHKICKKTKTPSFVDSPAEKVTKTSNVSGIYWKSVQPYLQDFHERIKITNTLQCGYNIYDLSDYDFVLFNKYDSQNKAQYEWHRDGSNSFVNDFKFTVLINLSLEKYEAGHLHLFNQGPQHIKNLDKAGSAIMFKSAINHKITPVTKGIRHSMSLFIKGPRFI